MKTADRQAPGHLRSESRLLRVFLLILIMIMIRYVQFRGKADTGKHTVSLEVSVPELSLDLGYNR